VVGALWTSDAVMRSQFEEWSGVAADRGVRDVPRTVVRVR
jgi:hypothetical protein